MSTNFYKQKISSCKSDEEIEVILLEIIDSYDFLEAEKILKGIKSREVKRVLKQIYNKYKSKTKKPIWNNQDTPLAVIDLILLIILILQIIK